VVDDALARRFDAVHSSFFALASGLRDQNRRLAATRDLLLSRLITGLLNTVDVDLAALPPDAKDA
jgi:hypothetical protein